MQFRDPNWSLSPHLCLSLLHALGPSAGTTMARVRRNLEKKRSFLLTRFSLTSEEQVCERACENRDKISALFISAQMIFFFHCNNFQKLLGRKEERPGYGFVLGRANV